MDRKVTTKPGERLRRIRMTAGMSQRELADALGMHHQSYVYYEGRKFQQDALPLDFTLDVRRILTGRVPQRSIEEALPLPPRMYDIRRIPILNWVEAGQPAEVWEASMRDKDHLPIVNQPGRLFALKVSGNSMSRVAPDGAMVIVNADDRSPMDGKLYIAQNGDGATFKRFRSNPDRLEPDSHEPGHDTLFGEFEILGRVIKIMIDAE